MRHYHQVKLINMNILPPKNLFKNKLFKNKKYQEQKTSLRHKSFKTSRASTKTENNRRNFSKRVRKFTINLKLRMN